MGPILTVSISAPCSFVSLAEDNGENDTDKEVDQPATSTTTEEKNEEKPKNPDGVALVSAVVKRVVDGDTIEVDIDGNYCESERKKKTCKTCRHCKPVISKRIKYVVQESLH